jgi:hypothetical protein
MWKTGGSYDEVYTAVRALRGVTSPNVGFMCQLINWAVSWGNWTQTDWRRGREGMQWGVAAGQAVAPRTEQKQQTVLALQFRGKMLRCTGEFVAGLASSLCTTTPANPGLRAAVSLS